MDALLSFVGNLLGLIPVVAFGAPLVAFLVDLAKRLRLPDGYAPLLSGALNLVLYGVVFFAGDKHLPQVQNVVQAMTLAAPVILSIFVSLLSTAAAHNMLAAIGVGFKHDAAAKLAASAGGVG